MKRVITYSAFTCLIVWILLLFIANQSMADTYCVSSETNLVAALNDAKDNGSDDVIRVQQGIYKGNFVYASTESFGLAIEGGYTAICASRVVDPDNTVLDGGQNGVVLALSAPNVEADFAVDGLTLKNGDVINQGGGLYAASIGTVTLTNNTISENSASNHGGGIYFSTSSFSGSITLINNNISNNSANDGYGGGIHFGYSCRVSRFMRLAFHVS